MYQIKVSYRTGDSFGSSDEETTLEFTWKNIGVVKENLKRIEEHYRWYDWEEGKSFRYAGKDAKKNAIKKPEWMPKNEQYPKYTIYLLTDDRETFQISPMWVGYFERLYGAEIVNATDDDMSFTV